jgi:hypothetical protein
MSHFAGLIYDIHRWPVLIGVGIPRREIIIKGDWIRESCFLNRREDIRVFLLIGELGGMYTDDRESL